MSSGLAPGGLLRGRSTLRPERLQLLLVRHLWLGLIVFAGATVCLRLGKLSENLSFIWIANGLYIGFVLCINPRRRSELLPTAFAVNYCANRLFGIGAGGSLGLTLGDLMQVLVVMYPLRNLSVAAINLTHISTLVKLGLYAALLGCAAQAFTVALWFRFILGVPPSASVSLSSFCANALGAAVVIPLYWYGRRKPKQRSQPVAPYRASLAFLLFCAVAAGVFWQTKYPFLFLLFPVLIPVIHASAFVGAARAVFVTTMIGVVATFYERGPLMLVHTGQSRILVLQFFIAVVLVTAFPFAALVVEREQLLNKLQASETRYRELARLDGLTQLANRREFDAFLEVSRVRAVRQNSPHSLLLIDIDHFKKLNDEYGHTTGDDYLRKLAGAITEAVPRKTDLVARYGGEEFGVVLDSCDEAGALMVAERVQGAVASLSRRLALLHLPSITVSIGAATAQPDLRTPSKTLIDAADQGLYAAKRNGRNRIERGTCLMAESSLV